MDEKRSLSVIIAEACDARVATQREYDADDILQEVMADREVWTDHAERLARVSVRRLITAHLKARHGGLDVGEPFEQLKLVGFEDAPRSVSFLSGRKVKFISALGATAAHFDAAIKLRDDNIANCSTQRATLVRMRDFVVASGLPTFGQAAATPELAETP